MTHVLSPQAQSAGVQDHTLEMYVSLLLSKDNTHTPGETLTDYDLFALDARLEKHRHGGEEVGRIYTYICWRRLRIAYRCRVRHLTERDRLIVSLQRKITYSPLLPLEEKAAILNAIQRTVYLP